MPPWLIVSASLGVVILSQVTYKTLTGVINPDSDIACYGPSVTDGDTFSCGGHIIRLASIDAPEMPGHCRAGRRCTPGDPYAAKDYLSSISRGRVSCRATDTDVYGRTVARCKANGQDLSCGGAASHAISQALTELKSLTK